MLTQNDLCEEREAIQEDILCILDSHNIAIPNKMQSDICQVIVDRFKILNDKLEREEEAKEGTVEDYVRRGAALLDRRDPNWYKLIDDLDMKCGFNCVIGQISSRHYANVVDKYVNPDFAYQYGFIIENENGGAEEYAYKQLNELWKKEIEARKNLAN